MKLLKDRVLAEKIPETMQTKSGLFIGKDLLQQEVYKVLLVSEKTKYLKPGDIIKCYPNVGAEIEYNNKTCLIVSESNGVDRVLKQVNEGA